MIRGLSNTPIPGSTLTLGRFMDGLISNRWYKGYRGPDGIYKGASPSSLKYLLYEWSNGVLYRREKSWFESAQRRWQPPAGW
jgi:hypothetical protein